MISNLKLTFDELKPLYTRLLIINELVVSDVARYIISLDFLVREQEALAEYDYDDRHISRKLKLLESRHIDAVIAYKIGYSCYKILAMAEGEKWFISAMAIIKSRQRPSGIELHYEGCMHREGYATIKDYEKAYSAYKLAAEKGYTKSYVNLAHMHRDGVGRPVNYKKAFDLFSLASFRAEGMTNLAYMHEFGYGTAIDKTKSNELYIKAANLGEPYSINRCKLLNLAYIPVG